MSSKKRKLEDFNSEEPNNGIWVFEIRWSVEHTDANKELLLELFKRVAVKYVFQAESTTDSKTGKVNPHYQAICKRKQKIRAKQWAISLNDEFRGIRVVPASTKGKEVLQAYCMKTDTRVAGPWADTHIYLGEDLPTTLFPWQESLDCEVSGPVHPRHIIWYVNTAGGAGKSTFAKWSYFHRGIITMTFATAADLLNLVYKYQGKRAYFFDLSRTKGSKTPMSEIYQALESIKNGYFMNSKYETGIACFNKPHVVVFANCYPDKICLTADKWDIRTI